MIDRLIEKWARIIFKYPIRIAIIAFLIALSGGFLASKIKIKSNFADLLPDHSPSVIDLKRINSRVGGMGELIVSISGKNLKAMQRFADDLVEKLAKYPTKEILFIDYKIDAQKEFFEKNKYLYLSIKDLSRIKDEIQKKISREKAKANPFYVNLSSEEDEEENKEQEIDIKSEKEKLDKKTKIFDRYKDGYLTNEDGTELIIVIKTPGDATGVDFALYFVDKVEKEIGAMNFQNYDASLDVQLTGGIKTLPEEYSALRDDILIVSNMCVFFVLIAVALYYRSIKTTIIVSLGLLCGVLTTFGLTYLHIGYLTAATAFLASIVAGNGINFGIYFLARYTEERKNVDSVEYAMTRALKGTVTAVSTAAIAAGVSYVSLMATDFKGFNQFGFIGGFGMLICLIFALTVNPALCVIMERKYPFKKGKIEKGRIFTSTAAYVVEKHPVTILVLGGLILAVSGFILIAFLRDPYEYNYRNLRNQVSNRESGKRSSQAEKILGERSSPHTILASSFEEAIKIKSVLNRYTDINPDPNKRVIKNIKTLNDYLPGSIKEQKEKIELLSQIREMLIKHSFSSLKDKDRKALEEMIPPETIVPIGIDEIPNELVRPFVELDGTKGTLVLAYMADGMSVWNGRDLKRFADCVKEVVLADGTTVRSSGMAVIYSDMIEYVAKEGPRATLNAFLMVTLVIVVAFRKPKKILTVACTMASGVLLMMGVSVALGQKINFLNYIAIPIQFGIGVDYAVNIYNRYQEEGRGSIGRVLRSTGGAVMISATTTIVGYSALWFSVNGAINSFGTLANIGEVACLISASLLLPAFLCVRDKKYNAKP